MPSVEFSTGTLANLISYARNTCTSVAEEAKLRYPFIDGMADKVADFYQKYRALKLAQQVVDYDDLLEHLLQLSPFGRRAKRGEQLSGQG